MSGKRPVLACKEATFRVKVPILGSLLAQYMYPSPTADSNRPPFRNAIAPRWTAKNEIGSYCKNRSTGRESRSWQLQQPQVQL